MRNKQTVSSPLPIGDGVSVQQQAILSMYSDRLKVYNRLSVLVGSIIAGSGFLNRMKRRLSSAVMPLHEILTMLTYTGVKIDERVTHYVEFVARWNTNDAITLDLGSTREELYRFAGVSGIDLPLGLDSPAACWIALDDTMVAVHRRNNSVQLSIGGKPNVIDKYATLAMLAYDLLRKQLNRKPTGEDLRSAIIAASPVRGKESEIMEHMEQLIQ